jgi:esterase/lipase superfamily enzyme
MDAFFRAYRASRLTIPTYFIESTAPNNVDDVEPQPFNPPAHLHLVELPSDAAVEEIAEVLAREPDPNLVVMVHGFNNPAPDVLTTYAAAANAIEGDPYIKARAGLVCIGYRWPSESMGQPRHGTWDALPTLPTWILKIGGIVLAAMVLAFVVLVWCGPHVRPWSYIGWALFVHVLTLLGWTVCGLVLATALLRFIVYFRDNYRASNYGVPDLIQIIRAIDGKIVEKRERHDATGAPHRRVQLSFIGHSMGAFVVTNAIRSLSDLFVRPVRSMNDFGALSKVKEDDPESRRQDIGHVFRLMRFVLASPDIPAETLVSNRGNFLASALARFDEAYLFSNEGDAVLRQISTLANYFVFPTKSQYHGFRLGNVEILARGFGVISVDDKDFLKVLRVGKFTLQELYDELEKAEEARRWAAGSTAPVPIDYHLPKVFTYFDCTDYRDRDTRGAERPLLTFAKCLKVGDASARLRWYSHQRLLWAYLLCHQRPNVHGGYFEGELSQRLIYRLACLGFDGTVAAFGGTDPMAAECIRTQIRVLISPDLLKYSPAARHAALTASAPGQPSPPSV